MSVRAAEGLRRYGDCHGRWASTFPTEPYHDTKTEDEDCELDFG